jgi:hypothetical protein
VETGDRGSITNTRDCGDCRKDCGGDSGLGLVIGGDISVESDTEGDEIWSSFTGGCISCAAFDTCCSFVVKFGSGELSWIGGCEARDCEGSCDLGGCAGAAAVGGITRLNFITGGLALDVDLFDLIYDVAEGRAVEEADDDSVGVVAGRRETNDRESVWAVSFESIRLRLRISAAESPSTLILASTEASHNGESETTSFCLILDLVRSTALITLFLAGAGTSFF